MICGKIKTEIQETLKTNKQTEKKVQKMLCYICEQTGNMIVIAASHISREQNM